LKGLRHMRNGSNSVEMMEYSFLVIFANNGHLDAAELALLERLALEDGKVDEREREVLHNIFDRALRRGVAPEVEAEIGRFREKYGI